MDTKGNVQKFFEFLELLFKEVGNLTLLQAKILLYVLLNPGVTQKEIADFFGENAPTISRIIKILGFRTVRNLQTNKLEQFGYDLVRSVGDQDDNRAFSLHPTEKGKEVLKKLEKI